MDLDFEDVSTREWAKWLRHHGGVDGFVSWVCLGEVCKSVEVQSSGCVFVLCLFLCCRYHGYCCSGLCFLVFLMFGVCSRNFKFVHCFLVCVRVYTANLALFSR